MSVQIVIALIDLVVVTVLIIRRVDVRLVLLAAAVPLFAVSGGLKVMLTKLVEEMANPGTVVPHLHGAGLRLRVADYRM